MSPKSAKIAEWKILAERLSATLKEISGASPEGKSAIREEVRRFARLSGDLRGLAKIRLSGLTSAKSGRDRLLIYFKLFPGEIIEGNELQVVGGIQDFPRRVRELSVQFGYYISTGYDRDDLRPNQYVLERVEPDREAAEKWRVLNQIRRRPGAATGRILALLKAFLSKPVTGEQIAYVAKTREDSRRVRELRTQYGWRVVTKNTGRPDLPVGAYILESDQQLPEHDRKIPDAVYEQVLERDKYSCRKCGWNVKAINPASRRQFLEVHHVVFHHKGGKNDERNLITLCNVHHDEVHRTDIQGEKLKDWLKD
jgi:HNH endonuclease